MCRPHVLNHVGLDALERIWYNVLMPLDSFVSEVPQYWLFSVKPLRGRPVQGYGLTETRGLLRHALEDMFNFASVTGYWA